MEIKPKHRVKKWEAVREEWTKETLQPWMKDSVLTESQKKRVVRILKRKTSCRHPTNTKLSDVVKGLQKVWKEVRGYKAIFMRVAFYFN